MLEQWLIENGADAQFVIFFCLFGILAGAEFLIPRRLRLRSAQRQRRSPNKKHRWLANLLLTFLNIVVLSFLPINFFLVGMWAQEKGIGLLNQVTLPVGLFIIANLLARGFISFFTHYLMHKIPWLWRVHRVHHFDTELDVSSTVRFHPLEFIIALVPGILLILLFGLSPWLLLLYELLDISVTLFSHSNINVSKWLDFFLRYIIVTPDLHRVHHSSFQKETDSNFSAVFPIWDLIFGTFKTQTKLPQEKMELGLKEVRDERTCQLLWLLKSPFLYR